MNTPSIPATPTTGNGASDAVIISVIVIAGSAVIKDSAAGKFTFKPIVAGFMLGAALLLIAAASPGLAKGMAMLGVIGAVIENGPAVFKTVGGIKG